MSRFLLPTGAPIYENRCLWRPVCRGCLRQEMFVTIRSKDAPLRWGTEPPLCLWCIGSLHGKASLSRCHLDSERTNTSNRDAEPHTHWWKGSNHLKKEMESKIGC